MINHSGWHTVTSKLRRRVSASPEELLFQHFYQRGVNFPLFCPSRLSIKQRSNSIFVRSSLIGLCGIRVEDFSPIPAERLSVHKGQFGIEHLQDGGLQSVYVCLKMRTRLGSDLNDLNHNAMWCIGYFTVL